MDISDAFYHAQGPRRTVEYKANPDQFKNIQKEFTIDNSKDIEYCMKWWFKSYQDLVMELYDDLDMLRDKDSELNAWMDECYRTFEMKKRVIHQNTGNAIKAMNIIRKINGMKYLEFIH